MQTSQAWIELALKTLSCNQKELATRVGVSQTQVSKWKSGEHMSFDMEDKFRAIVEIKGKHPEFVLWAGSLEGAEKWSKLICFLADHAQESAETGYNTDPLQDELDLLCVQVTQTLSKMGVEQPKDFPAILDACSKSFAVSIDGKTDGSDYDLEEQLWDLLETNSYSKVIRAIFESLNNIWGFYVAYVQEVADDDGGPLFDTMSNVEACLLELAACKIQVGEEFAPKISAFRHQVLKDYEEWLTAIKKAAFRAGTPLRAELLDMLADDDAELGLAAEAESLGFNAHRLHPDIYMNELLVGMRTIHQVLPALLKKLDIGDFELDSSNLHINLPTH